MSGQTGSVGSSGHGGRYAYVETGGEAVESDNESNAPWSVGDQDAARAQFDELYLARRRVDAELSYGVTTEVEQESDQESSSPSSGNSAARAREEEKAAAVSELLDVAERASRVSAMQMAALYRKGRTPRSGPRMGPEVRQKVFGLEGTEVLGELEEAGGLYARLMQGDRVMTQYIARTGIGKTTKFASNIAKKCAMRVLLLEPDMLLARVAGDAQRERTRVRTRWVRARQEHLTVMTYADFCGQFYTKNGSMLLSQFDVIVMDEAHSPVAEIYAAKALVATYGNGSVSLLVLSATLDGEDSQAINNVAAVKSLSGKLVDAVEAGKLTSGPRCKDRTMLILPTDDEAARCHQYVLEAGHNSYLLDSASRATDCNAVRAAMESSTVVRRFVVVVEKYGTGHNFPVSGVYSDGSRRVYKMDEETRRVEAAYVPVTMPELKQHAGRVGRGMVQGAVAYAFTGRGEPSPAVELMESERIKAYLLLRAAGVQPLADIMPPRGFFPFGVTPEVAMDVLAVNLPCELAIRYFNRDGRISVNFARALRPFSQLQHYFVTSSLPSPIGFDKWPVTPIGGYYGSDVSGTVTVPVPFDVSDDELRVKIHAVSCIALGKMNIPEWTPQLSESEVSGDESVAPVMPIRTRVPRMVTDFEQAPAPPPKDEPWSFDARIEGQMGYAGTRAGVVGVDSYTQATLDYLHSLDKDRVVEVPALATQEYEDKRGVLRVDVMHVEAVSPVEVATPGGSVVVTLRKDVWKTLVDARVLPPDQMGSLVRSVKDNVSGFVRSNAFSNWSNVWLSFLRSCADETVISYVQRRGSVHVVAAILNAMYLRYMRGVQNVTNTSFVKAKFWSRIMKGRSIDQQLASDTAKGKVEIIQSERFFRRLAEIRACTAKAVFVMEEFGVFSPQTVTDIQRVNPIVESTGFRMLDQVAGVTRGVVRKHVKKIKGPGDERIVGGSSSRRGSFR